jgi:hypothetical protein
MPKWFFILYWRSRVTTLIDLNPNNALAPITMMQLGAVFQATEDTTFSQLFQLLFESKEIK